VPIWPERRDGHWLYVEQAAGNSADKPYRQRVYRLYRESDNTLVSAIYTFQNPLRFAGAYKSANPLSSLTPDSLDLKSGCEVFLQKQGDGFIGTTRIKTCPSELRGAAYATSEVTINATEMRSWDRGFNAQGEQVWGSTKGPYIFKRKP